MSLRRLLLTSVCAAGMCFSVGCGSQAEAPRAGNAAPAAAVELRVVKYDELAAAVKAQRGKVLVVDIWGEF